VIYKILSLFQPFKMASKRGKGRGKGSDVEEISKEEFAVSKYMRANIPTKTTTLCGMKVDYFVGAKAIDALLSSKWGESAKASSQLFQSRDDVISYCQKLLDKKQLFHRARKIIKTKKEDEDDGDDGFRSQPRKKKMDESESGKKKKKRTTLDEDRGNEEDPSQIRQRKKNGKEDEGNETPVVKEKKKKRIKLDMHEDQTFIDGNEAYVWIYNPLKWTTFLFGLMLVAGAIAVCLFPLWPEWMRIGAYYLSLVAASLLGVILALSIFRYILYAFLWLATLGKVHFFLLPNLTEDVGFFESFVPVYDLETNWGDESGKQIKKKKKKKLKDSDGENESDNGRKSPNLSSTENPTNKSSAFLHEENEDTGAGSAYEGEDNDSQIANSGASGSEAEDYEIISHKQLPENS